MGACKAAISDGDTDLACLREEGHLEPHVTATDDADDLRMFEWVSGGNWILERLPEARVH